MNTQSSIDAMQNRCDALNERISAQFEIITPKEASRLLDRSKGKRQRPVKEGVVEKYAKEIESGNWQANGETIILNTDGGIDDGQHRCKAVVRTGIPIISMVVRNVPKDSIFTIGTGAVRGPGDVLKIDNPEYKNVHMLAAGSSMLKDWLGWDINNKPRGFTPACVGRAFTNRERVVFVRQFPGIQDASNYMSAHKNLHSMITPRLGVLLRFLTNEYDSALSDTFFDGVETMDMIAIDDPRAVLHRCMMSHRVKAQKAGRGLPNLDTTWSIWVKAWNAFITDKRIADYALRHSNERNIIPDIKDAALIRSVLRNSYTNARELEQDDIA